MTIIVSWQIDVFWAVPLSHVWSLKVIGAKRWKSQLIEVACRVIEFHRHAMDMDKSSLRTKFDHRFLCSAQFYLPYICFYKDIIRGHCKFSLLFVWYPAILINETKTKSSTNFKHVGTLKPGWPASFSAFNTIIPQRLITLSTGSLINSPLLFSLLTHDCAARHKGNLSS